MGKVSDRKRLHREDPLRTGPIRGFAGLYRRPDSLNGRANSVESSEQVRPRAQSNDPLTRGVELAYQVIEKYIVDGRRTAEQLNNQPYNARPPVDALQEMLQRMLRYQSDLIPLWVNILGNLVKVDPSRMPSPGASHNGPAANGASKNGARGLAFELASSRPVRVQLDLRDSSNGRPLTTHGLHAVEADKPALTEIKFLPAEGDGPGTLRISIPADQPPGAYAGVVVDHATGEPHGTLSVIIPKPRT
jgi:hypothetical protein